VNQDPFVLAGTPALVPALVVLALVVLALVVLALAVALGRARSRATRDREGAHAEAAALRARLEEVERRLATADDVPRQVRADGPARPEFVITHLGEEPVTGGGVPARVEPTLFADLVLREGVVRVVSLAAGVRAALAPEARNRIRFEVRREVRRARKQRRSDTRLARRELASRQRAALARDEDAA
jgi:hypothetical protein